MVFKIISSTDARPGVNIMIDNAACIVKGQDVSKSGRHGHAKCRIEAVGIFDGKKRIIVVPGHERFEVPLIEKGKAQVLSVNGDKANIMDLESFETLDMRIASGLEIKENSQVECWKINNEKIIKRVL